jgi:hypothetical protein
MLFSMLLDEKLKFSGTTGFEPTFLCFLDSLESYRSFKIDTYFIESLKISSCYKDSKLA